MNFLINTFKQTTLLFLILCMVSPISVQAKDDLYITDDYLKGLDDEAGSSEYLEKTKQELRETELREQSQTSTSAEVRTALTSLYNFEGLLRVRYPASHEIYSTLSVSSRVHIFDQFKITKKLSTAKRLIIEKRLAK